MRSRTDLIELWDAARTLSRLAPGAKGLPPLWFVTDPARTPDPEAVAERLPGGCGVIYRHFGDPRAEAKARALARLCRDRGLVLLIGADPALARRVGADGVHLPERLAHLAPRLIRQGYLVTAAAHGAAALRRARTFGCHAALLSPAFASRSPSAGRPLGPTRFAALARGARMPVFALGGITATTAKRLKMSGAAGLAAVEALSR